MPTALPKTTWRTVIAAAAIAVAMLVVPATGQGRVQGMGLRWVRAGVVISSYDYGNPALGSSTAIGFRLKNFGSMYSGKLTIVRPVSTAYSIVSNTCNGKNLAPKAYCTVKVKYAPSGGQDGGTLTATRKKPSVSLSLFGGPGHVYWTAGAVNQARPLGGTVTSLAGPQSGAWDVAVDDTNAYWVNFNAGTVSEVPLAGGSVTTLASGQDHPVSVAVDGTNVYWVNEFDGTVRKVPIGGGTVTTLATEFGTAGPWSVAVDGTNVYWVDFSAGTVNSVPVGGGSVTVLASGQENPASVAVDGTNIYWVNYADPGTVEKEPLAGGSITTLASGQNLPTSLAVDGAYVYWVNHVFSGAVNKVPLGGGSVTTLASGQYFPGSVAVDDTYVYWAGPSGNFVSAVPLGGGSVITLAQDSATSVAVGP